MQTVFHLTTGDPEEQETTLTIAENLTDDESVDMDDIAVVAQSHGIEPVTEGGNESEHVKALLEDGLSIKACSNTLDMMDIDETDLVDGVETVPSGGGELTRLQSDGYAYIRP
jgi:intracellular sulfur oxidation DsrE/DsrF family protein